MPEYTRIYRDVLLSLERDEADADAQQLAADAIRTLAYQVTLGRIALTTIRDSMARGEDIPITQDIARFTLLEMDRIRDGQVISD